MKKWLIILALVIVVYLAFAMLRRGDQARADVWSTKALDTGDIAVTITAAGTVEPLVSVQVGSQVSGRIQSVFVEPDQHVKKGEKLAALDPELLDAEVKDRELQLKQAQSSLAMLSIEKENLYVREQRAKLNLSHEKIGLERNQATASLSAKNLQRYVELQSTNAATQADVDTRQLERENTDRDVALKRIDLESLELDVAQIVADRKSLDARVRQAELNVTQAEQTLAKAVTNLGYASICSPIDGVVFERMVDPGQTIAASFQTPNLFRIVSALSTVRITAQIDEGDVGKIRQGQKVTFEVDAYRGAEFSGVVKAVRLKSETRGNLTTYPVIIEADNPVSPERPNGQLRPGMTAYLTFEVEKRVGVTRIPIAALRFAPPAGVPVDKSAVDAQAAKQVEAAPAAAKDEKAPEKKKEEAKGLPATIYIVGKDDKLKAIVIHVGESDGSHYELLSNELKSGDNVVTGRNNPALPPPAAE